jgi:HK97 family phage major capsid protein
LVRLSSPSAEEVVRRDLVEQIAAFMDKQFLDSTVQGVSGVNPDSITYGVSGHAATGTEAVDLWTDMNTALATFDSTDLGTGGMYVLMPPAVARGISSLRNLVGGPEFAVTPMGGTLMGFPVIVSTSVPSGNIILIKANEIMVADDGAARLDASNQATLNMAGVSPGEAASFNLWQRNCIGLRAERWITWAKRRSTAVDRITSAAYAPGTSP